MKYPNIKNSAFLAVARTEMLLVSRNGLFRILSAIIIIAVYIPYSQAIFGIVDFDLYFRFVEHVGFWPGQDIHPASFPNEIAVISTLFLSFLLAIVASMSIRREQVLDTFQAVHSHDMSNILYTLAKGSGILIIFAVLTFILMIPVLILDLKGTDIPLSLIDYLIYPALINFPAFTFVLGIAFLLATRLDARFSAFFIITPLLIFSLIATAGPYRSILDLFAVRTPMLRTDVSGFGDLPGILIRRSIFFLSGLGSLFMTSLLFKREGQSRRSQFAAGSVSSLCMAGALSAVLALVWAESSGRDLRAKMKALDAEASDLPSVTAKAFSIELEHDRDSIRCRAEIAIENRTGGALDRILFILNPGLDVTSTGCSSGPCDFERETHHLSIIPARPLNPGCKDTIEVSYHGTIDDEACYLFISDLERWRPQDNRFGHDITSPAGRFSLIEQNNLVLLPQVQWYPQPGVADIPGMTERCTSDFHSFTLTYSGMDGLIPISQGRRKDMEDGRTLFFPSHPVRGISVIAGDFRIRSIEVDGTEYSAYTLKEYDNLDDFLPADLDTLPAMIRRYRDEYDSEEFTPYPFERFIAIELPSHIVCHTNRLWPGEGPWIQPEMMLVSRDSRDHSIRLKSNIRHIERMYRERYKRPPTEREITDRILHSQMYIFGEPAYSGAYNSHRNLLVSSEYPVIAKALDVYGRFHGRARGVGYELQRKVEGRARKDRLDLMTITSRSLRGRSLQSLLNSPADPDSTWMAVVAKGMCLFSELEARLPGKKFHESLSGILAEHSFSRLELADLAEGLKRECGIEITPIIRDWYCRKDLPCFDFYDIRLVQSTIDDHPVFNLRLKATNSSGRDGVFVLSNADLDDPVETPFLVEGGTTKEIGLIFYKRPKRYHISSLISNNLPNSVSKALVGEIESVESAALLDGERLIEDDGVPEEPSIIVDNEDPGFKVNNEEKQSFFDFLPWRKKREPDDGYVALKLNIKTRWTPCLDNDLYGVNIHSAFCISAGQGTNSVSWTGEIPASGTYDLYTYLPKPWAVFKPGFEKRYYDHPYHFTVFHAEGRTEQEVGWLEAETGWALIGRYYFEEGPARVELSDESDGGTLIADAVKWVRR